MGSPVTHKWMWKFYTPKIQILEVFPFTEEGWKKAQEVEKRIILQDLNNPLCLNEGCGGLTSLLSYAKGGLKGGPVGGPKGAEVVHREKDSLGRSVQGVKNGSRLIEEKDDKGRSVNCVKGALALSLQLWESTIDGFRSGPGPVANHNKANGWDPNARIRVK